MIPKTIHQIWIGNKPIPDKFNLYTSKMKLIYPNFEYKLWDNSSIESIIIPDELKEYYNDPHLHIAFKCDVLRYLILQKHGGLYFDIDFEPLKKLPEQFLDFDFLGGIQNNGEVAIGFIGASKNNLILSDALNNMRANIEEQKIKGYYELNMIHKLSGPEYFDVIVSKYKKTEFSFFFTPEYFYPYWTDETDRSHENFSETSPLAYAVHHWNCSWIPKN